jgi:DnaK suppressor protein
MTSSHTPPLYRERLLQERAQLLQRIAEQRGGLVSRADMAAEHDVRDRKSVV